MARMPKCKSCKQEVDKENQAFVQHSGGYYHQECYEVFEQEKQDRQELLEKISELYEISYPTGWMLKQIKEFYQQRNYKYRGMLMTITFMYEVERVPFDRNSGLGLIPFYYEKARAYYKKKYEAVNSIPKEKVNTEVIVVEVSPIAQNRTFKTINMEELI